MTGAHPIPVGIHIGLPEEQYFGAGAFGSTDYEALSLDPETWWWQTSPLSPLRNADEETNAQRVGKAVHACLLEGVEAYQARFAVRPDAKAHPNALDSVDDMKKALGALGLAKSGTKADMKKRIKDADPDAEFLDDIIKDFMAGRAHVTEAEDMRLRLTRRVVEADKVLQARLADGLSEVSVFWDDPLTRQRNRSRFDRLAPGGPSDLKTFTRRQNTDPEEGAMYRARDFRWHVQVAHYWDAWDLLPELPIHGGTDAERELVKRIQEVASTGEITRFLWLFYPNNGAPSPLPLELRRNGAITVEGERKLKSAKENFLAWHRIYGLDKPWIETAGVREVDDERHSFKFIGS